MAIVLPGSFVYLPHLYTGGAAVMAALKQIEGALVVVNKRKGIGHYSPWEKVRPLVEDQLTGTETIFTTVANPYDALTGAYVQNDNHFQIRHRSRALGRECTFKDFLEVWCELNRPPYMNDNRLFYHASDASVHLRYETLQRDLDTLMRRLPDTPGSVQLGPVNETPDKDHWTSYFTDAAYAFVNEQFQDEIVEFGYAFVWSNDALV